MRWLIRLGLWLLCGDVLLVTRGFLPPRMLVLIGAMAYGHGMLALALPHYALAVLFWQGMAVLGLVRFVAALGRKSRRLRAHYHAPATGLPWTAFFTGVRPAPTWLGQFVFEPAVAVGLAYLLYTQSAEIVLPYDGLRSLLPVEMAPALHPWLVWLDAGARRQAGLVALLQLAVPVLALLLHNWHDWRQVWSDGRADRLDSWDTPAPGLTFDPVRVQKR